MVAPCLGFAVCFLVAVHRYVYTGQQICVSSSVLAEMSLAMSRFIVLLLIVIITLNFMLGDYVNKSFYMIISE